MCLSSLTLLRHGSCPLVVLLPGLSDLPADLFEVHQDVFELECLGRFGSTAFALYSRTDPLTPFAASALLDSNRQDVHKTRSFGVKYPYSTHPQFPWCQGIGPKALRSVFLERVHAAVESLTR